MPASALAKLAPWLDFSAYMGRYSDLKSIRSTWDAHWRELGENLLPRRMRFLYSEANQGRKKNDKIINSTGTFALRVLASGMMSGITSPVRPWFRLLPPHPELYEDHDVRAWLHDFEESMRTVFLRSNIYQVLPSIYRDLGGFGTSPLVVDADPQDVIRGYVLPVGSYCIEQSERLTPDTLYNEMTRTVRQLVNQFGLDNVSSNVKQLYESKKFFNQIPVVRCIEPNDMYQPGKIGPAGRRWRTIWFEMAPGAGKASQGHPLGLGAGFEECPFMAPRWEPTGEDAYGASPGMDALGDVKALQKLESRKLLAIERIVNPPMTGPTALKGERATLLSGELTYVDTVSGSQKFEPAIVVDPKVIAIREEIMRHEERIREAFYADIFLMISRTDQPEKTAREIDERHEEKMLQLGPVLERIQDELLDPLIDRTAGIMFRAGLVPPAPPQMQGLELRVEYISIMAQAQKLLGTASVERMMGFVGASVETFPEIVDKVNIDKTFDSYTSMLALDPDLVVTGDELAARRQARAQQEQLAAMAAGAKPLKDVTDAAASAAQAEAAGQPLTPIPPPAGAGATLAGADALGSEQLARLMSTLVPPGGP